jgi:hypothetical protein
MIQSILTTLRFSADELTRELDRLPAEAATWRHAEGEWSQHECLTHIQLCERHIFLPRLQAMATQPNPTLPLVDEVALQQEQWDPQRPRAELLADYTAARQAEIDLLEKHDWARPGQHPLRGSISMGWMANYAMAHTLEHLSQMMRVRLYYEASQSRAAHSP